MKAIAAGALALVVALGTPIVASPQASGSAVKTVGGHAAAVALRAQALTLQTQASRQRAVAAAYRRDAAGWLRSVDRLQHSIQILGSNPANATKVREARSQIPVDQKAAARALRSARSQDALAQSFEDRAHRLLVEAAIADTRP